MEYRKGDLIAEGIDTISGNVIAIPANSKFQGGGRLVMGAGFALQVAQKYGSMPDMAAMAVRDGFVEPGFYGFAFVLGSKFALFQSKVNPHEPSSLELIEKSLKRMLVVIKTKKIRTEFLTKTRSTGERAFKQMHIPMPGIGLGGLDRDQVATLLEAYLKDDDRFVIWEKE